MAYIEKCTNEQIKELAKCYCEDYEDISIQRRKGKDCVEVELINDCIPENYILEDYNVIVYDWDESGTDCLKNYRKKMLEFFGNDYALDYLLSC